MSCKLYTKLFDLLIVSVISYGNAKRVASSQLFTIQNHATNFLELASILRTLLFMDTWVGLILLLIIEKTGKNMCFDYAKSIHMMPDAINYFFVRLIPLIKISFL